MADEGGRQRQCLDICKSLQIFFLCQALESFKIEHWSVFADKHKNAPKNVTSRKLNFITKLNRNNDKNIKSGEKFFVHQITALLSGA